MPFEVKIPKDEYLPLINMKGARFKLGGRSTSVIKDPQVSIIDAIKEHDSELLTAILTEESAKAKIDLNHVYDEHGGQTMLHVAVEADNHEAVRLLVASGGVDCNQFNRAKSTALHLAARNGQVSMLQILLGSGKADINATMTNGETILHILARKCSNKSGSHVGNLYLECLKLALRAAPGQVQLVDATENTADMTALFIATEESVSKEAAILLIKANADINKIIDGIDLKEALVKKFGSDVLTYQPMDLETAMEGLEVGNRSRLLKLLNQSVLRDTLEDFQVELGLTTSADDINKSAPGVYTLVQVACELGLDKHLAAMLEQVPGVDVNHFSNGTEPALILAAKMGHGPCLQVLLNHQKTDVRLSGEMGTILHTLLRKPLPHHDYEAAFECLQESTQFKKLRTVINQRDGLGNTALHYATQFWPQSVVLTLLELGSNIGLKNVYDEVPIDKILPEVMENFLDTRCLIPEGDVTNTDFKITAKFDFLVPFGTTLINYEDQDVNPPLPETEGLWYMSQSKKHRHLLKHPVIGAFLWMKWKKIGFTYNANICWFTAFVALITAYIFKLYSGTSISSVAIATEECIEASKVDGWTRFLWGASTACLIFLALRETLQLGIAPRRYIFTLENWVDVSLIALTSILLFHGDYGCHVLLKRQVSAFIIVLSWSELITMIGRHPKLTEINIYVTMLYRVLGTFIQFLAWYSLFILAFALGFYVLLHQDYPEAEDHDYTFFDTLGFSVIKTFTMFVGELEFGDLPIKTGVGYIYLLAFIFLIVVVLMNLLNGLAVSDTGVIRAEAEVYAYKTQVEIISYLESTILGDPFNFLANWPAFVWLRKLPSCSIIGEGRLYKMPQIRKLFHRLTRAQNIMLFQLDPDLHPNGYAATFLPNQDNGNWEFLCNCCVRSASQEEHEQDRYKIENLPSLVAESAKDKVHDTLQKRLAEEEKNQLESRLARMEILLNNLLEKMT